MEKHPVIIDIECFVNFFLVVIYDLKEEKEYLFELSPWKNEMKELKEKCKEISWYIGYNNLGYDCPLVDYALKGATNEQLFLRSTEINNKDKKYYTSLNCVDLMLVNHYNPGPKATSLKKLAFTFRRAEVYDLPIKWDKPLIKSKVNQVRNYCIKDVQDTKELYNRTLEKLKQRKELSSMFQTTLRNLPDPSMCEEVFCAKLHIDKYKLLETYKEYPQIVLKDLIFKYIGSGTITDYAREFFESLILSPGKNGYKFKDDNKKYFKIYEDSNTKIKFALGGVHGVAPKGVYSSDEKYIIKTCDVASEYPNCILNNGLYPVLIGEEFISLYKWIYKQRFSYPKKSVLNEAFKLLLNVVYGKTNNEYSIFRDPKLMYTVTINCQLMMAWLCDKLSIIPDSKLIELNTDGATIIIPREHEALYNLICTTWQEETKFKLEFKNYNKMIIQNVNNYMAQYEDGSFKRVGLFVTYDDIMAKGDYNKDTSNNIVPLALTEYYLNGTDPEEFVRSQTNIHEFLLGAKRTKAQKKGSFEWLKTQEEEGVTTFTKSESRLFRYYASNSGFTLSKLYEDRSITNVHSNTRVTALEKIKENYKMSDFDINYDWYLAEIYNVIKGKSKKKKNDKED